MKASDQSDEYSTLATAKNMKLLLDMERSGTNSKQGLFYETELVSGLFLSTKKFPYYRYIHYILSVLTADWAENPLVSDSDVIVARLLHLATMQCPGLPKSWFALANWCYKWGRKSVDNAV